MSPQGVKTLAAAHCISNAVQLEGMKHGKIFPFIVILKKSDLNMLDKRKTSFLYTLPL